MGTRIFSLALAVGLFFAACKTSDKTAKTSTENTKGMEKVAYTVAKNYFVKNTVVEFNTPKIETAEEFEANFGMATTMGADGKPTDIDFAKQFVIAVVLPSTDYATKINAISLVKNAAGELVFNYKVETGKEKQSYTMRPMLAIIVDKTVVGKVVLKQN
jgi:hypothetical protein